LTRVTAPAPSEGQPGAKRPPGSSLGHQVTQGSLPAPSNSGAATLGSREPERRFSSGLVTLVHRGEQQMPNDQTDPLGRSAQTRRTCDRLSPMSAGMHRVARALRWIGFVVLLVVAYSCGLIALLVLAVEGALGGHTALVAFLIYGGICLVSAVGAVL